MSQGQLKTDRDYGNAKSIKTIVRNLLHTIYTSSPGIVEEYDERKRRAVVRGALKFMGKNGVQLQRPRIFEVPVIWPGSPRWFQHAKLEKGDPVELIYSMRGIDAFLQNHQKESSASSGLMAEQDAIAIPCFGVEEEVEDTDLNDSEYRIQKFNGDVSISMKDRTMSFFIKDGVKQHITDMLFKIFGGSASFTLNKDGSVEHVAGSTTLTLNQNGDAVVEAGSTTLTIGSNGIVNIQSSELTHNGTNVGDDHTHLDAEGRPTTGPM